MTTAAIVLLPAFVAALGSYALTPPSRLLALKIGAVDRPGPRKVHKKPMARLGGLAVIVAAALGLFVAWLVLPLPIANRAGLWTGIGLGLLPIVAVSIWDDISPLRPGPKFAAHTLAAVTAVSLGISLGPTVHVLGMAVRIGWLSAPISWLWLIGVTNAFNIVDGLDGLSAGLALIAAGSLAAVFLIVHQVDMAAASLVVAGALVGFLPYNLYPARVFLGDTGSSAIGFCLACFALRGGATLSAGFATLLPVFILGLPIIETLVSIVRRSIDGVAKRRPRNVFQADRNHFHHRLMALGLGHRNAVLLLCAIGLVIAGGGLVSVLMTTKQTAFLLLGLLMAGFVGVGRLGYEEFGVLKSGFVLRFYEAPMLKRSMFIVFVDLIIVALAVCGSIALKYDDWTVRAHSGAAISMMGALAPVTVLWFWTSGLYRGSWRLAGIDDFMRSCRAVLGGAFSGFLIAELVFGDSVPLSLFATFALLELTLANGARLSYRALLWTRWSAAHDGRPALIYGAGQAGASALRELLSNREVGLRPIGFIDDNPQKLGTSVNGRPVLGVIENLPTAILESRAEAVVVSSRKISEDRIRFAAKTCREFGIRFVRMEIRFDDQYPVSPDDLSPALLSLGARR